MTKLITKVVRFYNNEDGPTAVEYAIMLALIAAVCIVAIQSVGTATSEMMNDNATQMGDAFAATGQFN